MTTAESRASLLHALRDELLGPAGGPEEELQEAPCSRYLCGMLAPYGTALDAEETEDSVTAEDDQESSEVEFDVPLAQAVNPSSIGLSFVVENPQTQLRIRAEWGRYTKTTHEDGGRSRWRRSPVVWDAELTPQAAAPHGRIECPHQAGVYLEWLVQNPPGIWALSVFLVNRQPESQEEGRNDQDWIFQPTLRISAAQTGLRPFSARMSGANRFVDADGAANALLYRSRLEFAAGHGVSADWDDIDLPSQRAEVIFSSFIPSHEVANVVPSDDARLSMESLGNARRPDDLLGLLTPLIDGYQAWISDKESTAAALEPGLASVAREHARQCRETVARMRAGLEALRTDERAFAAFKFANQSMLLQRSHTVWAAEFRNSGQRGSAQPQMVGSWRPFQLAFILQNLPGITGLDHPDRGITDLLWFPTGGGKTEAYLGLAAFTLAYRRQRGRVGDLDSNAGVTVIMRYTLRMLTVQQFQRAAALICACEKLRREDRLEWGAEPFRIGLWVGRKTTPNSFQDSLDALSELRQGNTVNECNPLQLTSCPWCGERLSVANWNADRRTQRTIVTCPRADCDFSGADGIPIVVVDDEIYRTLPSIVIATVDKLARMPWLSRIRALFGHVDRYCNIHGFLTPSDEHPARHQRQRGGGGIEPRRRLLPPDLIIQDELHLISGPLGTLVALYETAVEWLASVTLGSGTRIRPKVIASTATIRRAAEQVRALFNRDIRIFPPAMIDVEDSYFAREQPLVERPGRLFVGISAPGKSMKTALVRIYALFLAAAEALHRQDGAAADPYMTLVGYFNSLRELGGAIRLVEDDVRSRLLMLNNRMALQPPRYLREYRELTSREDSTKIPELLRRLEQPFQQGQQGPRPIDILLASNMISVGVDIDRLGLMVVTGQPKTTSEYIQATSRVGRRHPGLVVTLYKWARPRDLSHYERFRSYHSAFYRHVEAISVTPFSSRARDRGLHGLLVAMSRLGVDALAENPAAFSKTDESVQEIVEAILSRVRAIEATRPEVAERIREELDALMDIWAHEATTYRNNLRYAWQSPYKPPPPGDVMLMKPAGTEASGTWDTPNSLREVEPGAALFLARD